MGLFNINEKIGHLKSVKDAQLTQLNTSYNIGLYNGLELAIAMLEERDPSFFMTSDGEDQTEEEEEPNQRRTVSCGVRRVKK